MRHLSSMLPFPFLNSRTIPLLPHLLFFLPQPVHTLTLRSQVWLLDIQSGLRTSLFFLPVRLRDRESKATKWERWSSQHGVSVFVDLLLPVYWIDADQSTATSRPCRSRWPEEETPLLFLEWEFCLRALWYLTLSYATCFTFYDWSWMIYTTILYILIWFFFPYSFHFRRYGG